MKKYRVEVFFDGSEVYEVEAENEDEAREEALSGLSDPVSFDGDNYEARYVKEVK